MWWVLRQNFHSPSGPACRCRRSPDRVRPSYVTALKKSRLILAHSDQRYREARARPRAPALARNDAESRSFSKAAHNSAGLLGSTKRAPSPAISGRQEVFDVTTGTPAAIACATGKPKPSYSDGYANAVAPAVSEGISSSAT